MNLREVLLVLLSIVVFFIYVFTAISLFTFGSNIAPLLLIIFLPVILFYIIYKKTKNRFWKIITIGMFVGLVCFIVIYFFYGGPPRQPEHIAQSFRNAIKNQACAKLVLDTDCVENPSNILVEYDANNDGEINQSDNLQTLAENFYDCEELECVKRICECPGY